MQLGLQATSHKLKKMARARALDLWGCYPHPSLPRGLEALEILSLPNNAISSLAGLPPTLGQLYLQGNAIPFTQLAHLRGCPSLQFLMLSDNPCATHPLFQACCLLLCASANTPPPPPPPSSPEAARSHSLVHSHFCPPHPPPLGPALTKLGTLPVTPEMRAGAEAQRADVEAALGSAAAALPRDDSVAAAVLLLLEALPQHALLRVQARLRELL